MSDADDRGALEPASDDPMAAMLREHGANDETVANVRTLGAATVDDLAVLTEQELVTAGMLVVKARNLRKAIMPAASASDVPTAFNAAAIDTILPTVPDDGPWLAALRAGGVLKVDVSSVMAVTRAALANRVGMYDVIKSVVPAMERFADTNEEQVPAVFFELRKLLTRTSYGDIFEAIPGLDGTFVTEARKRQLFQRIDQHLWPAILAFWAQLDGWQRTWLEQGANPAMLMALLAGGGSALPPGLIQPPDTGVLRDQSADVADAVNRVFAGTGVQITAALAYEATQIRKTLEDPRLPSLIGAANRDQMLRQLGVAVSPAYTRLETNLTRFVLACVQAQDQPADLELQYFGSLYMLGNQLMPELGKSKSGGVLPIGGGVPRELGRAALYDVPEGERFTGIERRYS